MDVVSRFDLSIPAALLALVLVAPLSGTARAQQNTERDPLPNPYETVSDVVTMTDGRVMGSSNAVDVDSHGNIWLFERCGANNCSDSDVDPILQFDPEGKLLQSFGGGMFVFPHGIVIDDDDNVWTVDAGVAEGKGNQIIKFSPEGEVLMTIGQPGVRGETETLLNEPSDLAVAPNGDIYVADGHISQQSNTRIVRFDRTGRFVTAWGSRGTGPGQFDCPHSLALDSEGRVFVGDRTNNRLQIFSPDGDFIAEWKQFGRPSGVRILNDVLYVVDSESRAAEGQYGYNPSWHRGIRIGSVDDGVVTTFIPDPNPHGATSHPEGISVADDGTIWGASVGDRTVWKWVETQPPQAVAFQWVGTTGHSWGAWVTPGATVEDWVSEARDLCVEEEFCEVNVWEGAEHATHEIPVPRANRIGLKWVLRYRHNETPRVVVEEVGAPGPERRTWTFRD